MNNSELLRKTLKILKDKKAGKAIIRDFTQFLINFEEIKKQFHLTFPENPDSLHTCGTISNESTQQTKT